MIQRLAERQLRWRTCATAPARPDPHADPRARHPGRAERPRLRSQPAPFAGHLRWRRHGRATVRVAPRRRDRRGHARSTLDHARQRTIDLSHIEILVLDEADRMLDMGFIRDIRSILALLPDRRQNLLFSATFSNEIRGRRACSTAGFRSGHPAQHADGARSAGRPPRRSLPQARAPLAPRPDARHRPGVGVHAHEARGEQAGRAAVKDGIATAAIHGNKSQPQRASPG